MTICKVTGMACNCQPDEGVPCDGERTLKEGFHGWRNAALKAEARLSKAIDLLKEAHSALDEVMEGRVVFDIAAFLKENGHE